MKKINKPTDPVPEVYKLNLDNDEFINSDVNKEVPQKNVFNYDLKKLKSFRVLRKNYKAKNQLSIFLQDMDKVLNEFDSKTNQLDLDLLVLVLNISEQYFIYGDEKQREEMKSYAVKKLMIKYFRNDEEVLNKMIGSVWQKVSKTNMLKRLFRRISMKLFFF
jgi:hypothetical protein